MFLMARLRARETPFWGFRTQVTGMPDCLAKASTELRAEPAASLSNAMILKAQSSRTGMRDRDASRERCISSLLPVAMQMSMRVLALGVVVSGTVLHVTGAGRASRPSLPAPPRWSSRGCAGRPQISSCRYTASPGPPPARSC